MKTDYDNVWVSSGALSSSTLSHAAQEKGPTKYLPSRLFAYSICKKLDGLRCAGTTDWWAKRVSKGYGMCDERLLPYNSARSESEVPKLTISHAAYRSGYQHRSFAYQRLYTLNDIRRMLAQPICIPPPIPQICFELFQSAYKAPMGRLPVPGINEKPVTGHCVSVLGYNDTTKELHFLNNSWGPNWGDKGFGYLPYEFFKRRLVNEIWVSLFLPHVEALGQSYDPVEFRNKRNERMILMTHQLPSPSPGRPRFWVFDIYRREKLVGWAHCSVYVDRETLEIEELFVKPESRRLGVGERLLEAVEDLAKFCMVSKMRGWIHRQDLLSGRYQIVKFFFRETVSNSIMTRRDLKTRSGSSKSP